MVRVDWSCEDANGPKTRSSLDLVLMSRYCAELEALEAKTRHAQQLCYSYNSTCEVQRPMHFRPILWFDSSLQREVGLDLLIRSSRVNKSIQSCAWQHQARDTLALSRETPSASSYSLATIGILFSPTTNAFIRLPGNGNMTVCNVQHGRPLVSKKWFVIILCPIIYPLASQVSTRMSSQDLEYNPLREEQIYNRAYTQLPAPTLGGRVLMFPNLRGERIMKHNTGTISLPPS